MYINSSNAHVQLTRSACNQFKSSVKISFFLHVNFFSLFNNIHMKNLLIKKNLTHENRWWRLWHTMTTQRQHTFLEWVNRILCLACVGRWYFFFVNIKNNKNNMKSTTFYHKTTLKGTCIWSSELNNLLVFYISFYALQTFLNFSFSFILYCPV